MIRVGKSERIPQSLITTKKYDGEDTKEQLLTDQRGKCYICERQRETDFVIEHLHGQKTYPKEIQLWTNLHLACSYCNGKKLGSFDNILHPSKVNIEEEVEQKIDFMQKKALFTSVRDTEEHQSTVSLLEKVFNGTNKIRNIKEKRFFNRAMHEVSDFLKDVNDYRKRPSTATEKIVRDELSIEENFLGFKYWIIKKDPLLMTVFGGDIVWNKR